MSGSFWKPSDEQRRAILLLEVAGLFHDLGKLSNGFIRSKSKDGPADFYYDYDLLADPNVVLSPVSKSASKNRNKAQERARSSARGAPFKDRADITQCFQNCTLHAWDGQQYNLAEILLATACRERNVDWSNILGKSMQPAKLIKFLHGIAHYEKEEPERNQQNKQPYTDTWAASPFGTEKRVPVDSPGSDLTSALQALPLNDIWKVLSDERVEWLSSVRELMAKGVAETQRPTNEVSLWDWGYVVASLTKASAAYIFKKWPEAHLDDISYRTLCISLNRLLYYSRSHRITDLLGVCQALDKAFESVRKLIEETYALGNRIHHDETGEYYLFPDLYKDEEIAALKDEIQSHFPPDLQPQVYMSDRVTCLDLDPRKSTKPQAFRLLLVEPRLRALQTDPICSENNLYLFEREWSEGRPENAAICTVCGVRPIGYPREGTDPNLEGQLARTATQETAEQRGVCRICLDRRGRRAAEWMEHGLQSTIWIDEVADDNGRVALFVGKLGLDEWLDGPLLETIQVTGSTTKNQSPARFYRLIETGRAFWHRVTHEVMSGVVGQRGFRLALCPGDTNLPDLRDYYAYELDVTNTTLSALWDRQRNRFIVIENLDYFARRLGLSKNDLPGRLEGLVCDVRESSEFQKAGELVGRLRIHRVERLGDPYEPSILLLTEPEVCMALLPADKALDLVRQAKREYEEVMGRVRDRLPVHLGLVFFLRHTPIRAVIDAGRAMLDMGSGEPWEGWKLVVKDNASDPSVCRLVFDNGISWRIPVITGSGEPDIWYPRMYEGDSWDKKQPRHVKDLTVPNPSSNRGDLRVWIRPSHFDFELLDTVGRRFDIYYDAKGRRPRRTRPFYLEDMDRLDILWNFMRWLAPSQRYQVIYAIEATRETWYGRDAYNQAEGDAVFRQFVADTLAGAAWPDKPDKRWTSIPMEWRTGLIEAGVKGELADLVELHMEILKE